MSIETLGTFKPQHEHPIAQMRKYFVVDMRIEDARIRAGKIRGTWVERYVDRINRRRAKKGGAR